MTDRKSLRERIEEGAGRVYTIDEAGSDKCVVACPPHPEFRGNRNDSRLVEVGKSLNERDISCFRFDYGDWDGGEGETQDVVDALDYARERWEGIGLFGYSFGSLMASKAVLSERGTVDCLALLSPPDEVADYLPEIEESETEVYVLAGERDTTLDSSRVIEEATNSEWLPSDHFFVGQKQKVGDKVAGFFEEC